MLLLIAFAVVSEAVRLVKRRTPDLHIDEKIELAQTRIEEKVVLASNSSGITLQRPRCRPYDGTVWAFCDGFPHKRWGIGPEGQAQAVRNCDHSYSLKGERCNEVVSWSKPYCQTHAGTIYAMCDGHAWRKWGIGPEGQTRALGNCKHAVTDRDWWCQGVVIASPYLHYCPVRLPWEICAQKADKARCDGLIHDCNKLFGGCAWEERQWKSSAATFSSFQSKCSGCQSTCNALFHSAKQLPGK